MIIQTYSLDSILDTCTESVTDDENKGRRGASFIRLIFGGIPSGCKKHYWKNSNFRIYDDGICNWRDDNRVYVNKDSKFYFYLSEAWNNGSFEDIKKYPDPLAGSIHKGSDDIIRVYDIGTVFSIAKKLDPQRYIKRLPQEIQQIYLNNPMIMGNINPSQLGKREFEIMFEEKKEDYVKLIEERLRVLSQF